MKLCIKKICLAAIAATVPLLSRAENLKPQDFVAVIGDSITEQKDYSVNIEEYLLMCQPAAGLKAMQFGWGGETASGFKGRMNNDCFRYQPTVATTCYGMNDGGYSPMDPNKAKGYRDNQKAIVEGMKKAGVRFIVVGSPGCVDTVTFRNDPKLAAMYNKTLGEERDLARQVAKATGEQTTSAVEITKAVDLMRRSSESTARAVSEQAKASSEVSKEINRLADLISGVSRSMSEQTASSLQLTASGDEIRVQSEQAARAMSEQVRALKDMTTASENVAKQTRLISGANREHSAAGAGILINLTEIRRIADRNAIGAKETASTTRDLIRNAEGLTATFQNGSNGSSAHSILKLQSRKTKVRRPSRSKK